MYLTTRTKGYVGHDGDKPGKEGGLACQAKRLRSHWIMGSGGVVGNLGGPWRMEGVRQEKGKGGNSFLQLMLKCW